MEEELDISYLDSEGTIDDVVSVDFNIITHTVNYKCTEH